MHIYSRLFGTSLVLLIVAVIMRIEALSPDHDVEPTDIPRITHQQIREDVLILLARGEKINAIKRVQALTGMGVKDAKIYVEGVQAERQM